MAGEWETSRLGDSVTHQKGFAFKSADYRPNGHPIVRVSNFTDRSIDMAECSYLDHDAVQQYEAYKLRPRDAVIATVGSWPTNPASVVGKTICVPKQAEAALLNQNAVLLRSKADLDQRFLFYLLKQPDFQTYIVGTAQGSASQASITLSDIFGFEFQRPLLAEQKAIAAVLGALDDKIELNRRMNATLEAMARALFQSWFVDFDPVRAKLDGRPPAALDPATAALFPDSFEHCEAELIPRGWRLVPIAEIADINYGKNLPATELRQSGFPVYGAAGVVGFYSTAMFNEPVTLVTSRGSGSGTVHQTYEPAFITNNSFTVIPRREWLGRHYLRFSLLNADILSLVTGSAQPQLTIANFSYLKLLEPSKGVTVVFHKLVDPLWTKAAANDRESRTLATLRDSLLPKLLSGELSVTSAASSVEDAV